MGAYRFLCLLNSFLLTIQPNRPVTFSLRIVRQALPYLVKLGTPHLRRKFMELVPSKLLQQDREIVDTMDRTSKEIFEEKKKALRKGEDAVVKQVGMGKDIMSVLCELCCLGLAYRRVVLMWLIYLVKANMAADEKEKLPEAELLGQMKYAHILKISMHFF